MEDEDNGSDSDWPEVELLLENEDEDGNPVTVDDEDGESDCNMPELVLLLEEENISDDDEETLDG